MIKIMSPKDCCGCTACASICNHDAITMKPDALGFLYPIVDIEKCTNCGLCEKVCAFNDNYDTSLNLPEPKAYGARHKDIEDVMRSRSGAVFVAISDYILENYGVVYGVGYKDHFRVIHKRATTTEERDEFRGSKYVQSDLTGVFRQIKKDLQEGKTVLFVGTGCQVAGLNSYINAKLRENLWLVDIVCHGTPSPYLWRDYVSYIEEKSLDVVSHVNFRDKERFGWAAHQETFKMTNKTEPIIPNVPFYRNIFFRKSCGVCHFCNTRRPSDITIADYWGWEKLESTLNSDDKGMNLVLLNTRKGLTLFEKIKDKLNYVTAKKDSYLQPNLCHPTPTHAFRDVMEHDYIKHGFEYVFFYNYNQPSYFKRLKRLIQSHL